MLEFTGEGVYAPALIFIRDGIKYVHCRTDPPMMFDLNVDPEARPNKQRHSRLICVYEAGIAPALNSH